MTESVRPDVVHVTAPGKINVALDVGALLDDGYHEIASVFQAVGLYEDIRAYHAEDFSVSFTGDFDCTDLPVDASNLAIQAAMLLAKQAKYRGGVRLEIHKSVPIAGGMGGGSADAAGTLVACDALWQTHVGKDKLVELAKELGADVPFALMGGTAIGTGRGDQLSPVLTNHGHFEWVLVLADFGMSTPAVYAELDAHRMRHQADILPAPQVPFVNTGVLQALRVGDAHLLAESMSNDLQAPSLHLQPSLVKVLEFGEENGALAGIVSGSGPTLAFLAEDTEAAIDLHKTLKDAGHNAIRVSGPVHGARVVQG